MTAPMRRNYRFATGAQWQSCLLIQADRNRDAIRDIIRPIQPLSTRPTRHLSAPAHAPVMLRTGEILWCDERGDLHRLASERLPPVPAPTAFHNAPRVIATADVLWVHRGGTVLECYDSASLTRLHSVTLADTHVLDIASGDHGGVVALVIRSGRYQIVRHDRAGNAAEPVELPGLTTAAYLAVLRRPERIVVLGDEPHQRLSIFNAAGDPLVSVLVASLRPCFRARWLASDGRQRIFLAGASGAADPRVLVLDQEGSLLEEISPGAAVTGLAAARDSLLVTDAQGLLHFTSADVVPDGAADVRCVVVTPMMQSSSGEGFSPWLRTDVSAYVPTGSTIRISYAATDDIAVRDRVLSIMNNSMMPASYRVNALLTSPDLRRSTVFYRGRQSSAGELQSFSAPLFDAREQYLWVYVELTATGGATLPSISELTVSYPGHSLMEQLPAVYRRSAQAPDNFLRGLVGVLETTTQAIDARIASMGSRIHPSTAPESWLNFIARWLGLPWDDGLTLAQKQGILAHADEIATGRGTRAGLEALLASLIPGAPARYRVTDATADFGFAIIGGGTCAGSRLPAMLGEQSPWNALLDSSAVLNVMRLPCTETRDDRASRFVGHVRVEVAATAEERLSWQPWLSTLINTMVPLTARVELRWVSPLAMIDDRLDGDLTLLPAPTPHLGTDAVTGIARLPHAPPRLSSSGHTVGTRLR